MMMIFITLIDNSNDDRDDATSRLSSNVDSKILASSDSLPKDMISVMMVIIAVTS